MRVTTIFLSTALLVLGLVSCSGSDRVEGTDGTVLLSITDFDGLPVQVSVNTAVLGGGIVSIGEITIQNIVKNPNLATSDLMNVEMQSYEVTFERADAGTRLPPPLVAGIFGTAPVGGTEEYENLPILRSEQLENPPLSDLLVENGSFDSETGAQTIVLNLRLRFFGRQISGEAVATAPAVFTVEFVP